MKKIKLSSALMALLAGGAFLGESAHAQLLNSSFSNGNAGLGDWVITGSITPTRLVTDRPVPPLSLRSDNFGFATGLAGRKVLLTTERKVGDGLVATQIAQKFSLDAPKGLPSGLGRSVGRLKVSEFGGASRHATLNFNIQFFSAEAPGSFFDYGGASLNGQPFVILDNTKSTGLNVLQSLPNPNGFIFATNQFAISQDLTHLIGTNPTLAFFVSDTVDSIIKSGLVVSNLSLDYQFVAEDTGAIWQAQHSGLAMVNAQRQTLLNVAFNANRDVNARLFRLRAEADSRSAGVAGPSGDGKESKEAKKEIVPEEKRWSFFATGAYGYRDQNNIDLTAGFQSDIFTATVGGEYKITPALTVGLAASRIEADNDFGGLGSADIEGWSFDGYVSYAANHFYADLLYALGTYDQQIDRHTGFGSTATARPDSLTNSIQLNTGYNIPVGRVLTGPLASLNWVHGDIDGYNEQQAGNANLTVPEQHVDSLTTEFGWQVSLPIRTGFGSVTPQAHASWVHEYLNTDKQISVGLSNSPYYLFNNSGASRIGSFKTSGSTSAAGDDYLSLGAGVALEIGDRAAIIADWETHFFQDHASSQNVSLTGQIKF